GVRRADRLRDCRKRGQVVRGDRLLVGVTAAAPNDGRVATCGRNPPAYGSAQALVRTGSRCLPAPWEAAPCRSRRSTTAPCRSRTCPRGGWTPHHGRPRE